MKQSKQTLVIAFALFSLFFGAGNLILPPYLGYNAGDGWFWVLIGFSISAVIIPILAIYGHAKLQGTILDFANKVSPTFAVLFSILIYLIAIALPSPRTASFTYEMAIEPFFQISSLELSSIYFALVLVFVLNRNRMLSIIGKFLTPLIVCILLIIICFGLFTEVASVRDSIFNNSFAEGILEGYQTFDAIGGVVVGGVVVISLSLQGEFNYEEKKRMIIRSGLFAGLGLFLIYGGLIVLGAHNSNVLVIDNRTELLSVLSIQTLGNIGNVFLSVLIALACFTTAVGIVTGTADFVKELIGNSQKAYIITAIIASVLGVIIGQFNVHYIINIALPILMFIYPMTIVLIILNVLPENWASTIVFRGVVLATFIFSIPDFLKFFIAEENLFPLKEMIPLSEYSLGWVLPAIIVFLLFNLVSFGNKKTDTINS
ncbi:branched-chain amino acid transport system II carrier protein [Flavobacteriaceae bacterium]|nr:branched-chain amino acid transport system carrier protein [uncultured bacterium]MDB9913853.1 branched-chain amino acid transport system II carrier protein [Flavobacteriaceae bacterium]